MFREGSPSSVISGKQLLSRIFDSSRRRSSDNPVDLSKTEEQVRCGKVGFCNILLAASLDGTGKRWNAGVALSVAVKSGQTVRHRSFSY